MRRSVKAAVADEHISARTPLPTGCGWALIAILLALVLSPLLLCRGEGRSAAQDDGRSPISFEPRGWIEGAAEAGATPADGRLTTRQRMVGNLLTGDVLDDVTMNDVARTMGTPDGTRPDVVAGRPAQIFGPVWGPLVATRWLYRLGSLPAASGAAADWLVLDFDAEGRLVARTIYKD